MSPYDVIVRPIITEQSLELLGKRWYTFKVCIDANKIDIGVAVEKIFSVKVEKVSTMIIKGKVKKSRGHYGRLPSWKKAIVRLTSDSKPIDVFIS